MASTKEILEAFYCVYLRSPTHAEFDACGGDFIMEGKYASIVKKLGYPKPTRGQTYEIISDETGEAVFIGTSRDIADEFDVPDPFKVPAMCRDNTHFRRKYRIRLKPFDVELVRKELEK